MDSEVSQIINLQARGSFFFFRPTTTIIRTDLLELYSRRDKAEGIFQMNSCLALKSQPVKWYQS